MPPIMDVEITNSARDKIRGFLAREGADGKALRLTVVRTHCMGGRGHAYDLRLAEGPRSEDATVTSNGLSLFVDPASAHLLGKVEIDYVEGLQESGFHVMNSNAVAKCPCGHHDLFR